MRDDSSTINPNESQSDSDHQDSDIFVYEFGPFRLNPSDPTDRRLMQDKTPVHLSPTEFRLLSFLASNFDRKVTKEELIKHLWPNACAELKDVAKLPAKRRKGYLDNLNKQVSNLKGKIGGKASIDTKSGYQLKPPVMKLQRSAVTGSYEDIEFDEWGFNLQKGGRITLAFGIVVGVSTLYLFLQRYFTAIEPVVIVSLIQAVVIAVALVSSFFIFGIEKAELDYNGSRRLFKTSLKRYLRYWTLLLWSWLLLYLSLALVAYVGSREHHSARFYTLSIAVTFFNNCNSFAIALCYVSLKHPSDHRRVRLTTSVWVAGVISLFLFMVIEYFLLFQQSAHVADFYLGAANVTSGIIGGVTLALYVRLLQRRFLYSNPWLPVAFYFYVLIQPLYFLITDVVGEVWIIEAALILKGLLFLYMVWLFKSGRLLILFSADDPSE